MQYLLGVVDVGAAAGILYLFLPSGIGLILLTLTGLYLFWQPIGVKWRRNRKI